MLTAETETKGFYEHGTWWLFVGRLLPFFFIFVILRIPFFFYFLHACTREFSNTRLYILKSLGPSQSIVFALAFYFHSCLRLMCKGVIRVAHKNAQSYKKHPLKVVVSALSLSLV